MATPGEQRAVTHQRLVAPAVPPLRFSSVQSRAAEQPRASVDRLVAMQASAQQAAVPRTGVDGPRGKKITWCGWTR